MKNLFHKANARMAQLVEERIMRAADIGIVGHIRPDGDDVGACLGLAGYIRAVNPEARVRVHLEEFPENFGFLEGADRVDHDFTADCSHDLCFVLDCADAARMGEAAKYFDGAAQRVCIDHHVTNGGIPGALMIVEPDRSSTCELICSLIDMDRLTQGAAESLYLGIVHDTGVFKHSNTGMETMVYAGRLIELGARPSFVIDNTFHKKTFAQNRALGRVLLNARQEFGGRVIVSVFTAGEMKEFGVRPADLDGFIDQLRVTEGTEVAAFIYELPTGVFKVSLRANGDVDVSRVAALFGGGGHVKAAGCDMDGTPEEICKALFAELAKQL